MAVVCRFKLDAGFTDIAKASYSHGDAGVPQAANILQTFGYFTSSESVEPGSANYPAQQAAPCQPGGRSLA